MREFQIFSDSSCDLPESLITEYDIKVIPFYVSFDQDIYYKENVDITKEAFFERLGKSNGNVTTSLPSVQEYINEFRASIRKEKDVLCVCLTQKFSGSYQSAMNAKMILEEQYPDANIHIIDSIQATAGQGLLLMQIAHMKQGKDPIDEVVRKVELLKPTARIMFTVDTLEYLSKGRRIGKAITLASDMLDLKPLIQLKEGELLPYTKVRGRKNSLEKLLSMTEEYFMQTEESPEDYDFCIANTTSLDDALYLQSLLETLIGRKLNYPIFQIGVTIGTYAGPGGIGICFIKKYDRV
jgi:DegV family protein with EDD domain